MRIKLLFLIIFIFVSQNFLAISFSARSKQFFNKIKSFPSSVYKRYRNRGKKKTAHQTSFKTGTFNKTQFHSEKTKKGYSAGGVGGILASLYAALWPKVNAKAEGNRKTSDKKEEIKKAALKTWKKEIKNANAFDNKELPDDLKKILDAHVKEIDTINVPSSEIFDFLPGYIVKRAGSVQRSGSTFGRIEGAKAMTAVIDQHHLTHLFVPKKYPYIAPDGKKYIIAKLVEQNKEPITKEELKQIIFLAKSIVWSDSTKFNFLKTPQGIAIIDTEPKMNQKMLQNYVTIHDLSKQQWLKLDKGFLKNPAEKLSLPTKGMIIQKMYDTFLTPEAEKYYFEKFHAYQSQEEYEKYKIRQEKLRKK